MHLAQRRFFVTHKGAPFDRKRSKVAGIIAVTGGHAIQIEIWTCSSGPTCHHHSRGSFSVPTSIEPASEKFSSVEPDPASTPVCRDTGMRYRSSTHRTKSILRQRSEQKGR